MKVTKPSQQCQQKFDAAFSPSSTNREEKALRRPRLIPSQAPPLAKMKENIDSKSSTRDRSHKLDCSQPQNIDLSKIISEPFLCDEMYVDNNLSGISLINILDEVDAKPISKEILSSGFLEENDILRRELEMKNRLVEKLMKENASIREEVEASTANLERTKRSLNTTIQSQSSKVTELQQSNTKLESENRTLKDKILSDKKDSSNKENEIQELESQIKSYCEETKATMEQLCLQLGRQVSTYIDASKNQYDNFMGTVEKKLDGIKKERPVWNRQAYSSVAKSMNIQPLDIRSKKNGSYQESNTLAEDVLTSSMTSLNSSRKNSNSKETFSLKRPTNAVYSTSNRKTNRYAKIDEDPEISIEKTGSTIPNKVYQTPENWKKPKTSGSQVQSKKKEVAQSMKEMPKTGHKSNLSIGTPASGAKKV